MMLCDICRYSCECHGLINSDYSCEYFERKGKIMSDEIIVKCNETFNCGWYVKRFGGGYLHKDLIWRRSTGFSSSSCYQFGDALGYYMTKADAIKCLQKYLCKESCKIQNLATAYGMGKRLHELLERGQNMKKGDVVIIDDWSYSKIVVNGKFVSPPLRLRSCGGWIDGRCVVVEVNCTLPITNTYGLPEYNDTIIQMLNTNEVIFIEQRFLKPITHTLTIDGKTVKLSHESYENLKAQLIN